MRTTYNDILNNMKNTFYEISGRKVEPLSDIGARMQAVASELLSLSCYGDFIMRQAFVQTATGKYLDYHAALRNIKRTDEARAVGRLTFSISEPMQEDIEIFAGTICSIEGRPYIQFETTENAVIAAGTTEVTVNAASLEAGEEYNVSENEITVMVNPPTGISRVINNTPFSGGVLKESDDKLRKRILTSYSVVPSGVTYESLEELVMQLDGIIDCKLRTNANSSLNVCLRTVEGEITDERKAEVKDKLMVAKISSTPVTFTNAQPTLFNLDIRIKSDEDMTDLIEGLCREYSRSLRIGENIDLGELAYKFRSMDGVDYADVSGEERVLDVIICPTDSYMVLDEVRVRRI